MEEFRELPEYPGYKIGNLGTIIGISGAILKPWFASKYLTVSLGRLNKIAIHRLVGFAWIPNPENKPCIDHINRDKLDNRVENLRWATHFENNQNMPMKCSNKTGVVGLYYEKRDDIWIAQKTINGIKHRKSFKERPEAEIYLQEIVNNQ